jgi:glycosyltransferase involved in cell wall biosynthesis
LLGNLAKRLANKLTTPLVFTHHTMYEQYTYVAGESETLAAGVKAVATGYANLADRVFAPSRSTKDILISRGVTTPIEVLPTGVDTTKFSRGDGTSARVRYRIPENAEVVGWVGRLAPEKNLFFLLESLKYVLKKRQTAHWLCVGDGPARAEVESFIKAHALPRCIVAGALQGQELVDAYRAMNVFAFASKSETQGMVLVEALAAGVPVVGLDAPGTRDVLHPGCGILVKKEKASLFASAIVHALEKKFPDVTDTAERFSQSACAARAIGIYGSLQRKANPIASLLTLSKKWRW